MNRPHLPPFESYEQAFKHLETSLNRSQRLASLMDTLAELHGESGTSEFKEAIVGHMCFVASETFAAVAHLDDVWLHFHNGAAAAAPKGTSR